MKGNEVQSAESRRVFVLLADRLTQNIAGDVECLLRQLILRKGKVKVRRQCLQNSHAHAGRGSETGSNTNLRGQKEIDGNVVSKLLNGSQGNCQLALLHLHAKYVVPCLHDTQVRGNHLDFSVRPLLQDSVEVFVDGGA